MNDLEDGKKRLGFFFWVPKALIPCSALRKPWTTGGHCLVWQDGRMDSAANSENDKQCWSTQCRGLLCGECEWACECGRSLGLTGSQQSVLEESVLEGRTVWGCAVPPGHSPQAWGAGQCGEPTGAKGPAEDLALSQRLHQGHAEGSAPPSKGWLDVWPCLERKSGVSTKDGRWGRGHKVYVCVIIIKTGGKQTESRERLEAYLTEPGDPWHCNTGSALSGCTVRSLWFVTAPAHNLSTPPIKKQRNQLGAPITTILSIDWLQNSETTVRWGRGNPRSWLAVPCHHHPAYLLRTRHGVSRNTQEESNTV